MRRLLATPVLLALVALAACGEKTVKVDSIESQIKRSTEQATGGDVTVECPEDTEAKVGKTFDCDLRAADKTSATAQVKITKVDEDAEPPLEADFNAAIVRTDFVADDIVKTVGSQLGIDEARCPTLVTVKSPLQLTCEVLNADDSVKNRIAVTTEGDRFRYRVEAG